MRAHRPSGNGYSYRKQARPPHHDDARPPRDAAHIRFRLFGLHRRVWPLYRQAGCPFGEREAGLLLWIEFGRRSRSN